MAKVIYTGHAIDCIDAIADYLAREQSEAVATYVTDNIQRHCEFISSLRLKHQPRPELGDNILRTHWKSYLIYYSRDEPDSDMIIRAVLHSKRRITPDMFE